jgi:hypothetical protein
VTSTLGKVVALASRPVKVHLNAKAELVFADVPYVVLHPLEQSPALRLPLQLLCHSEAIKDAHTILPERQLQSTLTVK